MVLYVFFYGSTSIIQTIRLMVLIVYLTVSSGLSIDYFNCLCNGFTYFCFLTVLNILSTDSSYFVQ